MSRGKVFLAPTKNAILWRLHRSVVDRESSNITPASLANDMRVSDQLVRLCLDGLLDRGICRLRTEEDWAQKPTDPADKTQMILRSSEHRVKSEFVEITERGVAIVEEWSDEQHDAAATVYFQKHEPDSLRDYLTTTAPAPPEDKSQVPFGLNYYEYRDAILVSMYSASQDIGGGKKQIEIGLEELVEDLDPSITEAACRQLQVLKLAEFNFSDVENGLDEGAYSRIMGELSSFGELWVENKNARLVAKGAAVPAADRYVSINHNDPNYSVVMEKLDELTEAVRGSNELRKDDQEHEQRIAELESFSRLMKGPRVNILSVKAIVFGTLAYFATQFADSVMGQTAKLLGPSIMKLLGLP